MAEGAREPFQTAPASATSSQSGRWSVNLCPSGRGRAWCFNLCPCGRGPRTCAWRFHLYVSLGGLIACVFALAFLYVQSPVFQTWRRAIAGSTARASLYARLAGAAYCPTNDLLHWDCGPKCIGGVQDVHICQGDTTKAFVAKWEEKCVLSIMGTQEYAAMVRDLEFYKTPTQWSGCDNCWVHDGFLTEWRSLEKCSRTALVDAGCPKGSQIRVTGHSLGGAISALAMLSLADSGWHIEEAFTFGMPRVGDKDFSKHFDRLFSSIFFRVTHHMDPVVHVPLQDMIAVNFEHAEPELFFDSSVKDGSLLCRTDGDETCSGQYSDIVHDVLHIYDHMLYMDIQIGTAGCVSPLPALNTSILA